MIKTNSKNEIIDKRINSNASNKWLTLLAKNIAVGPSSPPIIPKEPVSRFKKLCNINKIAKNNNTEFKTRAMILNVFFIIFK